MTHIGLIVALKSEVPDMFRDFSKVHYFAGSAINVIISGMGPNKAQRATEKCIASFGDSKPDYILNLGFCGAVGQKPEIGRLILADRVRYRNSELHLDQNYINKAKQVLAEIRYSVGTLETFNVPVFSQRYVSKGALAVDMEAYAIVETALQHQVPVLVIKAVSDIVSSRAGLTNFWRTVKTFKNNTKQAKVQLDIFVERYFQ